MVPRTAAVDDLDLPAHLTAGEAREQVQPGGEHQKEEQLLHLVLKVCVAPVLPSSRERDVEHGGVRLRKG